MESTETLLEHATWLRRLAASLVGDRAAADDLVQDTWVAALRRPPDTDRPLRPWLVRVVRNAARFRWRGDANRAAREAIATGDAETVTPTSEELFARHQLQQQLARLVGELDEPFRGTILLRYAEGLEPTQIARRLGIPAGTVRWRIKEGLERLRRTLDEAHGGDRRAWLLALAPIALWPRASRAAPAAPVAVAIVAAAGIVLAVGAMRRESPPAVHATDPRGATVASLATHAARRIEPSWFVQPGAPPRHVAGRVVRDGVPVPGARVRLVADDAEPQETRSHADGRFDFGVQGARTVTLGASIPDALAAIRHLDLRDPSIATEVELPLVTCSARIEGKVSDASGDPIPHAQVLREDAIGTETDASGAYELCALSTAALVAQLDLVIRADGYGAIVTGVAPAGRIRRDFVLAPEATITGTAAANAAIWIEPDRDDLSRTGERGARQVAIADGDGRFRIAGASGGRYRVSGAARGTIAVSTLVSVEPGGTADVTLRMIPAATVRGRVVMRGVPVAGAHVAQRAEHVVLRHDDPARDPVAAGHAVTQSDGGFVLDGVPVGRAIFTAEPVRVVTPPSTLVAGDNTVVLEAEPLGRIRGVVRRHGTPVPYARIDMNGPVRRGITTDGAGRFDLDGLEPGRYGFYADDQRRGAFVALDPITLGEGETRDYDIELAWGAEVSGTVVDPSGAPVAHVNVRFTSADREQARCMTDAAGGFTCGSLKGATSYTPTVFPGDDETRPLPFVTPAPALDLGLDASAGGVRLVIDPRTTALAGTVLDDTGAPAVDVRVHATGDGLYHHGWSPVPTVTTDVAGHFRFAHLAPGDYELYAETLHDRRSAQRVVVAGASDVVLTLTRPTCSSGAALDPPHKPTAPIVWDDRIELVGWDMPDRARVGEPVQVTLVFRVRAPILHSWNVFAHFDGSAHRRNADHSPVGESCPTSTWRPGDVLVDRFSTTLPFPETFALNIGFFRPGDGDGPWQNLAGAGDVGGVQLGTVTATAAE